MVRLIRSASLLTIVVLLSCAAPTTSQAQGYASSYYFCPILDDPPDSTWSLGGAYALEGTASTEAWDDVGFFEGVGSLGLVYLETERGGDFDMRLQTHARFLQGFDGTASAYPLVIANLFLQYSQRFQYGYGLRIDFSPGLYSDFKDFGGDDFAFPFGISAVRAFNEQFAFLLGVSVFPGFDQVADPRVGVRWVPSDQVLVDLFYPESRVAFELAPAFGMHLGLRFLPWLEYQLDDNDERDRLRLSESRAYIGIHFVQSEYSRWNLDLGLMFNREIEFEKVDPSVEIDDSPYFGLSYVATF